MYNINSSNVFTLKSIRWYFIALVTVTIVYSSPNSSASIIFDFEDNAVQYPSYGGVAASYATQDDAGVTRNMLKLVNGANSAWWSGVTLAVLPVGNDFRGDGVATMRVYAEQDGNLNLELEADGQGPAVVNLAVTQGWNDLSFDFSGADAAINWHKIQIRPDALGQANNAAETTYYIDDVSFPNSAILDTDDDGANDLVDDLPNDATETVDSDGDGVGDNADELPNDPAFSTQADYDAAQAIPASPVPTAAADSVLSIFSNAYTDLAGTDFNPGWGQATQVVVADDVITYTGLNYQGTAFTNSDVSGYGYINVDFYTADSTVLKFTIISPWQEKLITLADPIVLDQWNSVQIALTEFDNVNLADVFQFKFDGNGTVLIDNLYFGGTAPAPADSDGDGVFDNNDAFPNDASETVDTDGDGVGDNADVFPNDASETVDTDGDGVGDNSDYAPNDAAVQHPPITTYCSKEVTHFNIADHGGSIRLSINNADADSIKVEASSNVDGRVIDLLQVGTPAGATVSDTDITDGIASVIVSWPAGTMPATTSFSVMWSDDVEPGNQMLNAGTGADALGGIDTANTCSDAEPNNVTFSVDMTGVDLQGQFPAVNGTFNDWCGDCSPMSDEDGDNVWTLTVPLADGVYQYKYALGAWIDQEVVPDNCSNTIEANRALTVSGDATLAIDVYSGCPVTDPTIDPDSQVNVTFQVDMTGVDTTNGVSVMGGAVFGQAGVDMSDVDGDNIWTVTTALDVNSTVAFKYRNNTALTWDGQEPVFGSCTFGEWNDRLIEVAETDITLPVVSFGSCTAQPIVVDTIDLVFDFEDNTVQYPSYGGLVASFATQDDAGVMRNMLKLVNGEGAAWWSGVTLAVLPAGNDFRGDGVSAVTMRVYAEQDGDLSLELETDDYQRAFVNLAVTQGWNDLSFDFSGADAAFNWNNIQIRPDALSQADNAAETTYYIDDVTFPNASILDSDGDGVFDTVDDLPYDATETVDSDGDGVGDNADELPNDPGYTSQALYDAVQAAPTPTDAADSVLSIFSDAYTDLAGTDFNPYWGQTTQVTVADGVITYTGLNFQGTDFPSSDVSGYGYINLDLYTPNATNLEFIIISPGEEMAFPLADQIVLNQWNSVKIPLTEFNNVNLTNVLQFKFHGNGNGNGNGTLLLDNIYFGGTAPAPVDSDGDGVVDSEDYAPNDPSVQYPPTTTYCATEVTHFNIADHTAAILLTVENSGADSITVTASAADNGASALDFFEINGVDGGGTPVTTISDDGVATTVITWAAGTMPATTSFTVLWSDDVFGGLLMVNNGTGADALGDIDTAYTCSDGNDAGLNFTVSGLPAGTTSVRIHSEAFGWDVNHPDGVATDNGDGTWTATIAAPWPAGTQYKWMADFVEEWLIDNAAGGECSAEIDGGSLITDYWSYGNRVWVLDSGDAIDVFGNCSDVGEYNPNFPTDPAPTPNHPLSSVISIYSDAYWDTEITSYRASWSSGYLYEDSVSNNNVLSYSGMGYAGVSLPSIDATSYKSFHMDVWSPNDAKFKVKIVNDSNPDYNFYTEGEWVVDVTAGQWQEIVIYDASNSAIESLDTIGQLVFKVMDIYGNNISDGSIIIDNVYFFNPDYEPSETSVSLTVNLPSNVSSVRLHSEVLGWDPNHPEGVATNNGDGTWTATIPSPWAASTNYKWMADGVEENLKDDVDAGYCANDGLNSGDWGANRVYSGSGDVTGDIFGKCSETPTDAGVILNIPQIAAPAPAAPQYSVISVFSDSYNDVVDDFRAQWSEAQTVLTSAFIGDNNILKYSNMGFVGIDIPDPIDASSYESFHADVWSPVDATVRVEIINTSNDDYNFYTKAFYEIQVYAGQWKSIYISNLANSAIEDLETIGQLSFSVINNDAKDGILVVDNIYFFDPDPEGQQGVTFTVSKPGANDVRLTGPSWNWSLTTGPVATDNGDGTWTFTFDPAPTVQMEYLWVADGVRECSGDDTANRLWAANSGNVNDVFDACPPAESTSTDVTFTVAVEGAPESVRMAGFLWNHWDIEAGPIATDNGDGTWSAFLPLVGESFQYLWVIDGQQEGLVDNAVNGECTEDIEVGIINTDYGQWANRIWNPGDGDVSVAYDTCMGSYTGLEDSDNDGIVDIEDADDDNDGVEDVNDPLPLDPNFSVMDEAAFINIFGGAVKDDSTHVYTNPAESQSWAGYANGNQALYPITVTNDSLILFTASVPSGGSADVRFVLESEPHPNNDVVVSADVVEVSGSTETTYTVALPAQGAQEFNSLLMYLDTKDTDVMVKHVTLISKSILDSDNDGVIDTEDAFPNDPSESLDTDNDGIGNNADTDDDGDGVTDTVDGDPLDPSVGEMPQQLIRVKGDPSASIGGSVDLVIEYDTSNNDATLSGLGVSVHYDSSSLTFTGFADVLSMDNITVGGPFNDYEDLDTNPATDKYVSGAWASIFASWPGELPAELLTLSFDVADTVTGESTPIGFSSVSNSAGYIFSPASYDLPILVGSWDFDEDGNADALTDGLLLLRYAFGLRGDKLADDAVVASGSNLTAQQIQYNLERSEQFLDIDNNGTVDALTDGLILMRYLFGLRGEPLTIQAIAPNAQRLIIHDIEAHIQQFMP